MATPEALAQVIRRQLDTRMDKEAQANKLVELIEAAGSHLEDVLITGLAPLIEQGEHRGAKLCVLQITQKTVVVEHAGIQRNASIPFFEICLGDEIYQLAPKVDTVRAALNYSVAGRKGMFITCETQPARTLLVINENNGRPFDVAHVLELVNMLLFGK